MRSKTSTLASTAIPMVSTIPAIPGRVSVAPDQAQHAKDQSDVQDQRKAREDPEETVTQHHEDQHRGKGHQRRDLARGDAVGAQFRPESCVPPGTPSRRAGRPRAAERPSSVDSSTVKFPVICPEPPVIACRITGALITSSSSTMAKGAPTLAAVYSPKARAPDGLNRKVTAGWPLCWSKAG